jgi:hypothetical protein
VNEPFKHAAAARMRDGEILLHHRAGAADLEARDGADMRQQEIVDGALDQVALGLVPWRDLGCKESKRAAIASGGGDDLGSLENFVHGGEIITKTEATRGP